MPALGRIFFPGELIERAALNGHEMTPTEAIFVLKDFARQGLVVPVGDGGWSVTERGRTSPRRSMALRWVARMSRR